MDWWVTEGGREPIGPVTTELLLRGIDAGRVPVEALVCEVGGTAWRALLEVEPFAAAAQKKRTRRFDEAAERTLVDPDFPLQSSPDAEEAIPLRRFDATSERTIVERNPPSELARFEEGDDRTIVDVIPRPPE